MFLMSITMLTSVRIISYVEETEHLRHHFEIKEIYAKSKETIERVFADAKSNA